MYSIIKQKLFSCHCESKECICNTMVMENSHKTLDYNRNNCKKTKPMEVKKEIRAIRNRFPNKVPVIVQRYFKETNLPPLDKSKYLVPEEITMSQFQTIIRNRMQMQPNQTMYLLVNDRSMLSLSLTLAEVYKDHSGPDGYLYVTYASQEVFGTDFRDH